MTKLLKINASLFAQVEQVAIRYVADVKANGLQTPFFHDAIHREKSLDIFAAWVAQLLAEEPDLEACQAVGGTVAEWNGFQIEGLSLLIRHLFLLSRLVPTVDDEQLAACAGAVGLGYSQQVHQMLSEQQHSLAEAMEQRQQQMRQQRLAEKHNFDTLLSSTYTPVVIHEKGTITNINQAVTEQFGYQAEELVGKHIFSMIPPQEQERILTYVQAEYEEEYEMNLLKRDGTTVPVKVNAKMMPFETKLLRFVFIQPIEPRDTTTPLSDEVRQTLTPREQDVMRHVAAGATNAEVAQSLQLSVHTVKFHLNNVYKKLGIGSRSEAASWWWQQQSLKS